MHEQNIDTFNLDSKQLFAFLKTIIKMGWNYHMHCCNYDNDSITVIYPTEDEDIFEFICGNPIIRRA